MYNGQLVGVGIVTCNRKDNFKLLLKQVKCNEDVDFIVVVKNKEFDYGENDPSLLAANDSRMSYFNVKEDLGVGYCKNMCLKRFVQLQCKHIFLIEDDLSIKCNDVFKRYIDTASSFNIQHMNFCAVYDSISKKYIVPRYEVRNADGIRLNIFNKLGGQFQYFTYDALVQVGLFDAKHYVNALEHVEYTYRMSLAEMTTPFYAFADIHDSAAYLEDIGTDSTIHYDKQSNDIYSQRIQNGIRAFKMTYGKTLNQILLPSQREVIYFLQKKIAEKLVTL